MKYQSFFLWMKCFHDVVITCSMSSFWLNFKRILWSYILGENLWVRKSIESFMVEEIVHRRKRIANITTGNTEDFLGLSHQFSFNTQSSSYRRAFLVINWSYSFAINTIVPVFFFPKISSNTSQPSSQGLPITNKTTLNH